MVLARHFPRAQARPPASRPLRHRVPRRASRSVEPKNGKNNRPTKEQTPLPPRVQKTSLRAVPRESKKRAGPRMAPRRNPRKKKSQSGGDRKKQKNKTRAGGVWCLVSRELYLFKEKREKKRNNKNVVNPNPKTERTRQKTRPDIKRIF